MRHALPISYLVYDVVPDVTFTPVYLADPWASQSTTHIEVDTRDDGCVHTVTLVQAVSLSLSLGSVLQEPMWTPP